MMNPARARLRSTALALACACSFLPVLAGQTSGAGGGTIAPTQEAVAASVAADIAALKNFHSAAKRAASRLSERGDEILPQLIEALSSPSANDKQRIQLINLLGELGDPAAIDPMIQLADAHPDWLAERRQVLLALFLLPQTDASYQFARRLAEDEAGHAIVRRTAVGYFGKFRDERGRKYVDRFVADSDLDNRAVGLYLAARLSDESVKGQIVELLALPAPDRLRELLLTGLSEVADAAEIERVAPTYLRQSNAYLAAIRLANFRSGSPEERAELVQAMLGSRIREEKLVAAHFILEQQGSDGLEKLLGPRIPRDVVAIARHELRLAGFRVLQRGSGVRVERKSGQ